MYEQNRLLSLCCIHSLASQFDIRDFDTQITKIHGKSLDYFSIQNFKRNNYTFPNSFLMLTVNDLWNNSSKKINKFCVLRFARSINLIH